jgi:hypothetical protein
MKSFGFFVLLALTGFIWYASIPTFAEEFTNEKIVNSFILEEESLYVIEGQGRNLYVKYNNRRIGPFCSFFALDKSNNMGQFIVKEMYGHLFFVVLATEKIGEGWYGSFPIIGYNDDIYYPYFEPGSSETLYYDFSPVSHELAYIKKTGEVDSGLRRGRPLVTLFVNSTPISKEYRDITPFKIDDNGDLYYMGEHYSGPQEICKNAIILFNPEKTLYSDKIRITNNNNIYYIGADDYSLMKNGKPIITLNDKDKISQFVISDDDKNIAYTVIHNGGIMSIWNNGKQVYKCGDNKEMLANPIFSPDGTKLYYYSVYNINGRFLAFYIKGPGIPSSISGPYQKSNYLDDVTFSNNSKYVAFVLESIERGKEGFVCIILNSQLFGPYSNVREYHFTDDSRQYRFQYRDSNGKWIDKVIDLR